MLSLSEQSKLNAMFDDASNLYTAPAALSPYQAFVSNFGSSDIDIEALFADAATPSLATSVSAEDIMSEINGIKRTGTPASEWLNDAATNYAPQTDSMFSEIDLPCVVLSSPSPYNSPLNFGGKSHESPLMQARALFPSPVTPSSFPPMFQNDIIPRCQSSSPLLRHVQPTYSPASSIYSSFTPSPMSRCSSAMVGQIDYSEGTKGSRRNLGVRTKAITPTKLNDGVNRKLKVMKEQDVTCVRCNAEIATLVLHGTEESVNSNYAVEMVCADCHKMENNTGEQLSQETKGARANVECDCCKRSVAVGGARMADTGMNWVDPAFGVEVICFACRDKYGFCTECGGGNRFRTGKWRPLSLFEENRRTCKFSHTRIGKTPVRFQTFHVGSDFSAANYRCIHGYGCSGCSFEGVVKELKEMYFDRKLFAYAVPVIMETVPRTSSWKKLNATIQEAWNVVESYLTEPSSMHKRRYIDFAFITPPVPRRKGKASKESTGLPSSNQMIAGFVVGEWDLSTGTFFVAQRCNRGVGGDPCSMVLDMSKNLITRAVADSAGLVTDFGNAPLPMHIYVSGFTRFFVGSTLDYMKNNDDRSYLREDTEFTINDFSYGRIGFSIVSEYVQRFEIDPSLLATITPATNDDTIFIVNLRDLMASSLVNIGSENKSKRRKQ